MPAVAKAWVITKWGQDKDPNTGRHNVHEVAIHVGGQEGLSDVEGIAERELIVLMTVSEEGVFTEQQFMMTRDQAAELGQRLIDVANQDPVIG